MAGGVCKFRAAILLFAFCSAVYIATGLFARSTSKDETTETENTSRGNQGKTRKGLQETPAKQLFNASETVLKVAPRELYPIKQLHAPGEHHRVQQGIPNVADVESDDDVLVYDCSDDWRTYVEDKKSVYGKPIFAKNKTVMYLSMPKCGSRTFVWTSMKLQNFHHFGSFINIEYMLEDNPPLKIRDLMDTKLQDAQNGAIVHGHYRYIDMYGSPKKPILMSMIRDPIDRFESHFYFMRNGDQDMSKEELIKKLGPKMALPNETLDDCIEKDRGDCTLSLYRNMYVTSFCGYDPRCSQSPAFALEQAKANVDRFLVIGIMEEYDLSMAVIEKLLPETFGGAAKIYQENKGQSMEKSKTSYKKPPSQRTYAILKQRMKYDYAFYDYVQKRLHKVAKDLGIGRCLQS